MSLFGRWRVAELLRACLDVVFPPVCAACSRSGREPFCSMCSEALVEAGPVVVPGLDHVEVCFAYGGPLAIALHRFKYDGHVESGRPLGLLMKARVSSALDCDVALPIPLAPRRLRHRTFNQAVELARPLDCPLDVRLLVRHGGRAAQVGSSQRARRQNVQGVFALRDEAPIRGRVVLLVDDVVTTGATLASAASVLRAAGARRVLALVLARAELGVPGA